MKNHPSELPISAILPDLQQALAERPRVVLQAPPGAGKSTGIPLAILDAPWLAGRRILLLAPRRLAARAACRRMADLLGEPVGGTVGYRVRMDSKVGKSTRIEVITEGVLTRMLQRDPSLDGVGLVIFDEFHERSLEADLALALCLDLQGVLNADLRLLVMSATLDVEPVAALLEGAPVLQCSGRSHPVETRHIGRHTPGRDMKEVVSAILSAAEQEAGNILVFLPGAGEIRQVHRLLAAASPPPQWIVAPLFGNLSRAEQDLAIGRPPDGRRKIVLATAIAETSLTIEGIRVVVDSGLQRVSRFDSRSGMSRLVTLPVSRASADQRRGRAGRLGPGVCLRLWSKAVHHSLPAARRPDILETDLCGLALELARWGVRHPDDLKWLDPPPQGTFASALDLLRSLNALDERHGITDHGRQMARLAAHPRLAHMLIMARAAGAARAACELAALMTERDPLKFHPGRYDADLQLRFDLLQAHRRREPYHYPEARIDAGACRRILAVADQLYRQLKGDADRPRPMPIGALLAWAFPDRIARRRPDGAGRFLMAGGQGVRLDPDQALAAEELIVAAEVDGQRSDGRIYRAAAYPEEMVQEQFQEKLRWHSEVGWDGGRRAVAARRALKLGALVLRTQPVPRPDAEQVCDALMQGIRQHGLTELPWTKGLRRWQARVLFLRRLLDDGADWPDVSDDGLLRRLPKWLAPFLEGMTRLRDLARLDLRGALLGQLPYQRQRQLDALAPTHWSVPSGSRIPIDYAAPVPILAVRVQEMFGLASGPVIAAGRQPLLLHLLSPAGRPVQVTQDLAGFWKTGYPQVKKELKGRYPKHYWPDDPMRAQATSRVRPRGTQSSN